MQAVSTINAPLGVMVANKEAEPAWRLPRQDWDRELIRNLRSVKAIVYSYTIQYHAPEGYENQLPIIVAMVEVDNMGLMLARLTEMTPEEVRIGMEVEPVFRLLKKDEDKPIYGVSFRRPVEEGRNQA